MDIIKLPNWLRWTLLLPSAIISYSLASAVVHLLYEIVFLPYLDLTGFSSLAWPLISSILKTSLSAVSFVVVGTSIAPKDKFKVCLALTIGYIVFTMACFYATWHLGSAMGVWLEMILGNFVAVFLLYLTVKYFFRESK